MSDLRALLYDHWCPKCRTDIGPKHLDHTTLCPEGITAALATRLPECVPPGLEWANSIDRWNLGHVDYEGITDEQAELLFIGKVSSESSACFQLRHGGLYEARVCGFGVIHEHKGEGPTRCAALAAALHRLADERETNQ